MQPFAHRGVHGNLAPRFGTLQERAKDERRSSSSRVVAQELFQGRVLVGWFGQDAPLFHRRSLLGRVLPPKETENPFPKTLGPPKRPVSLPRGGPWQYYETDWGPIDGTNEEYGGDYAVAEWVGERLSEKREQPFFLACGIYRPHEPWFVPRKYFEAFPLDEIQLPPGYRPDDLNDLTPRGKALARNRYFEHIQAHKQWKPAIQGYLASIHFADAMLGRILDALEEGPHAENTIVVLWSDHGWHLGEKEHWQKFTLWRVCTRVPLVVRVPKGTPGLPAGTIPSVCSKPVNLLSLAPTLFELCELAPSPLHDGPSLVPLLGAGDSDWPHPSVTHLHDPGSFGLSDESWRYIRYSNGEEELYDLKKDPYEWNNLAMDDGSESQLQRLREKAPSKFAKLFEPNLSELTNLAWEALDPHENPLLRALRERLLRFDLRIGANAWSSFFGLILKEIRNPMGGSSPEK